jgi:hypothetical protein
VDTVGECKVVVDEAEVVQVRIAHHAAQVDVLLDACM